MDIGRLVYLLAKKKRAIVADDSSPKGKNHEKNPHEHYGEERKECQ